MQKTKHSAPKSAINASKIRSRSGSKKLSRLRAVKLFLPLVIVLLIVFRFVIGISFVSGNSMDPTLKNGQLVFYSRLSREPGKGDVVSAKMPSGEYVIKRVIALSGDVLEIREGSVFVNGVPEDETYVNGRTFLPEEKEELSIVIPNGCLFIMGDNRSVSIDSRTYGAVAADQLRGTVISAK